MKKFETKNILIEVTEEEMELILSALNSAKIRRQEQGHEELANKFGDMWCELFEIKKTMG